MLRSLTVKTSAHQHAKLVSGSVWNVKPVYLIIKEYRQTAVVLPRATDNERRRIEHSLQLVHDELRRSSQYSVAVVNA